MGFNQRPPTPLDPDASPLLPQADSSQPHDIPTGVSVTTAKLQDWIAWCRDNGVFYDSPGVIANDITIDGELTVNQDINAGGSVIIDNLLVFDDAGLSVSADPGSDAYHSGNIPKVCGRIITDGVGGYSIPSSGVNLGAATVTATYVDVNFVRAFANADYCAVAVNISDTADVAGIDYANSTTTKIRVKMRDATGVTIDPSANVCRWSLIIMGRH